MWTLGEVRDGSGNPRGGQGRVGRSTGKSVTGRGTLGKVKDGSEDPLGGLGLVVGPSGGLERVGGPSERSGTG